MTPAMKDSFYLNPCRSWLRRAGILGIIKWFFRFPLYWRYFEYRLKRPSQLEVGAGPVRAKMNVADSVEYAFILNFRQDRKLLEKLLYRLKPGDTCWDVGANMGLYTVLFSRQTGESGEVVSFEPEEKAFRRLQENLSLNGISNVTPLKLALGRKSGQMKLQLTEHHGYGTHSLVLGEQDPEKVSGCMISVRAGDELRKEKNMKVPALIKLDVEGAEEEVLAGLGGTLKDPVCRTAACEVHLSILESKGLGDAPKRIIQFLKECGFEKFEWPSPSHFVAYKS